MSLRHPVHNTYLPAQLQNAKFLKKAGDTSGKLWDEEALIGWENNDNGGEPWEGRAMALDIDQSKSEHEG